MGPLRPTLTRIDLINRIIKEYQGVRTSLTRLIYKKTLAAYSRFPNLQYRSITKQPAAVGIELELSLSVFNRIEAVKKVNGINSTETTPVK